MPINTRSMKREVKQSPAKSSIMKPIISGRPPRGPQKTTKAKEDHGLTSSKRLARDPVLTQHMSTDVSTKKKPVPMGGFSSVRSKPNLKDVPKTKINRKNEEPVSLKTQFVDLGNYFSAALSKRREFYNLFKEAEEEFEKDFEFGKKLIQQKSTVSQIPLSHTPLGKKFYATINASSALKNKDAPHRNKRLRSPEECSSDDRRVDKLPASFEFGKGSPGRKKLIMENVALTTLNEESFTNVTYVQQPPQNIVASTLANAAHIQQKSVIVEPTSAVENTTNVPKKPGKEPEQAPVLSNATYVQQPPENIEAASTLANATYIQKKPVNAEPATTLAKVPNIQKNPVNVEPTATFANVLDIQKKPVNVEPTTTLADATYVQKKPVNDEPTSTLSNATYVQKKSGNVEPASSIANATYVPQKLGKVPAPGLANATYVQNKDADLPESTGNESSEELFSDDDMKACMGKVVESKEEPFLPEIGNDKKSEGSNSTSSSVSALVERFELKKMNKIGSNLKTAVAADLNAPDVASCSQEKVDKPMEKEPLLDNATFIFESSVVESPMDTMEREVTPIRDRSEASTVKSIKPRELQKEDLSKVNSTFIKPVAHKMPSVDQTFVVNSNKQNNEDSDSEDELLPPPASDKTYVKADAKKIAMSKKLSPILDLPKKSSQSSKSGLSTSSSSSGSMKSAVSQPSLTKIGVKNTVMSGSAGTLFEKQKATAKEAESTYKKRLMEKEEEAVKRKLEIDQRKMELQKKKNEEWKRKAEKMKAEEKKTVPMPASKVHFVGQSSQGMKGATLHQNPMINHPKFGLQMNALKPGSSSAFPSKFNPKLLMPSSDPHAKNYEEPSRDDSFRTADGCSFLDMTADVDPANNYDITRYEDIDEECKHREHKSIPDWARGDNITYSLFKQIPYEGMDFPFFAKADAKFRLFPNFGK